MKIRSGLIAISALAITSWGCSDRQTELPGASPQKFVDIETIESGEGSNDFTLESVEATSRTNIVRLGKRTVAFSNINVTDDLVWRIWNADEGWSTADEVEVVDSGLSLAIIERDGEREWFSESVNVDGALVPPKGVYRFRDLRDGYFVALSPTNLPIHLFRVSSNELTHILEVENPLPDENRGLRATLHPGGEWLSVFPNGDASTQRIISLTDGPRFDAQLPSNAIRYDFDGETYLNDGNEWTRINFELEDTVSFTPPWPAAQSIIRQAAFGGDIGAWVVSVGNNNPMDVWLGGDRFFDLRCIRTPRVFATDDTVFIECSSRVNETDIHLLDREAL